MATIVGCLSFRQYWISRGWCTRHFGCRLSVVGCRLLLPQPQPQWRWRVAWGSIRLLARLSRVPVAVHGLDHLSAGTSIAVANHPRWIDPLVLASVMPQSFHLVAAEVLEHQGLNGLVFRRLGHQFVERHEREHGVADADRLATPMRGGRSLVIFPEGGLVRPRVTPFPHGRIRGGRPNRRARCPGGYPRDADSIVARAPFATTGSHRHHRW
ncbi:MAG: lysophospholipid acyltransferase family protein [Mycobacterium sp.]